MNLLLLLLQLTILFELNCAKVTVNEPYTNSGLIDSQVQVDNDNSKGTKTLEWLNIFMNL